MTFVKINSKTSQFYKNYSFDWPAYIMAHPYKRVCTSDQSEGHTRIIEQCSFSVSSLCPKHMRPLVLVVNCFNYQLTALKPGIYTGVGNFRLQTDFCFLKKIQIKKINVFPAGFVSADFFQSCNIFPLPPLYTYRFRGL